jgi:hypothetical protein
MDSETFLRYLDYLETTKLRWPILSCDRKTDLIAFVTVLNVLTRKKSMFC